MSLALGIGLSNVLGDLIRDRVKLKNESIKNKNGCSRLNSLSVKRQRALARIPCLLRDLGLVLIPRTCGTPAFVKENDFLSRPRVVPSVQAVQAVQAVFSLSEMRYLLNQLRARVMALFLWASAEKMWSPPLITSMALGLPRRL